jgi:type IV secretory pathway VirB10-like protein
MPETPLSPSPPAPRRLNSFALVLLSLAGALLLATVVYFVSQRPMPQAPVTSRPHPETPEAAEPGFLRRAPRSYPSAAPAPPAPAMPSTSLPSGVDPAELAALEAVARGAQAPGSAPMGGEPGLAGARPGYSPGSSPAPYLASPAGYASAAPSQPADPRREAYQRALHASMSISTSATAGPPGALPPGSSGTAGLTLPGLPALRIPGLTEPLPEPAAPREAASQPQNPTTAFLASSQVPRDRSLPVTLDPPLSATQLDAGSLIPAVLATGINSDLPGDLVAQVSRDVYDSRTERRVLIPKGSRLLGRYQNQVATGERRLLVAWDRLLFPDGSSLRFPGLPGTSLSGEAGLPGSVDNHLPTVFGSALLLSLLSAGVQLSQPQESASFGQAASTRQVGAAALGQELSTVATELLRRRLAIAPTLRIPSGTEFQVFVRADLALSPYR